jgi:hypothetical protein
MAEILNVGKNVAFLWIELFPPKQNKKRKALACRKKLIKNKLTVREKQHRRVSCRQKQKNGSKYTHKKRRKKHSGSQGFIPFLCHTRSFVLLSVELGVAIGELDVQLSGALDNGGTLEFFTNTKRNIATTTTTKKKTDRSFFMSKGDMLVILQFNLIQIKSFMLPCGQRHCGRSQQSTCGCASKALPTP